jgi:tetratricopeptide (TPR) repeat protein
VVIQPVVQPPPAAPAVAEPAAPPSPALLDKLALGDRLQAAGDYRGALFAYQDAVYLNPRHALSRVKLGRAYWTLRYVGQADEQWAQATQLAPNDPSIARMIEEARSAPRPAAAEAAAATGNAKAGDPSAGQGGGSASSAQGAPGGSGSRVYKFVPEAQAGSPAPYPPPAADGGYSMPLPSPATPAQSPLPQYPQQPAPAQHGQPQYGSQGAPAYPPQGGAAQEYPGQAYGQQPQYAQPQYPQPQYGQPPAQYPQPSYGQAPYGQPGYGQAPPQVQASASVTAAAQRYRAAISLYTQRDYLGAIAELDAAITLDPNLAVAYTARGSAKYGLRKYREAAADYMAALDLDPSRAEPIWGLAECQRMLRDPAASDTYRRYAASVAGDVNEERRARARRWATELAPSAR